MPLVIEVKRMHDILEAQIRARAMCHELKMPPVCIMNILASIAELGQEFFAASGETGTMTLRPLPKRNRVDFILIAKSREGSERVLMMPQVMRGTR